MRPPTSGRQTRGAIAQSSRLSYLNPQLRMLCFAVSLSVIAISLFGVHTARASSMPPTDWSFYITTDDVNQGYSAQAYNLGCNQGNTDRSFSPPANSTVILDFGLQRSDGAGTYYFAPDPINGGNKFMPNSDISAMASSFAEGYYVCTGSDTTSVVSLAVGTNNSYNFSTSTYSALGTDWANLLVSINSSISGYRSQVNLWGANDIESWPDVHGNYVPSGDAYAWVNAYAAAPNQGYFDFGDANGCSQTDYHNTACAYGYYQADYYQFSWGAPPALAVPEIYSSEAAWQWARISQYASAYHSGMGIWAPLDENDLASGTLTASQAYTDLTGDLSSVNVDSYVPYSAEIHRGG